MGPLVLVLLSATLLSSLNLVKGKMTFYAVAVGQGDSAIIQCPNKRDLVIIDMGTFPPKLHRPVNITTLLKKKFNAADAKTNIHVIVTHPDADHYNLFSEVLDSEILPNIRTFILGGKWNNYKKDFRIWLQDKLKGRVYTINNEKKCFGSSECKLTPITTAAAADFWTMVMAFVWKTKDHWQFCSASKDVKFTVLGANIGSERNGQSVILKIQYKSWSMLMSGDFEQIASQKELMKHYESNQSNQSIFKSNYYKVAHHGAWTDKKKPNMPALLNLIQPEKVYISHGYPSSGYHHPKSETINNLKSLPSIVKIDPFTNSPFVYWNQNRTEVLQEGLDRPIYETCRHLNVENNKQVCHDIEITTNGKTDSTRYVYDYNNFFKKFLKELLYTI